MKCKMFVLDKSEKLGIDNTNFTINQLEDKLSEEFVEVFVEIDKIKEDKSNSVKNKIQMIKLALELLDVIQVCIAGLNMLRKNGINLNMVIFDHNYKLVKRGWTSSKVINIEVNDHEGHK